MSDSEDFDIEELPVAPSSLSLPDGYFDVNAITLMENNILGQRETHRLVLDVSTTESWRMGKVKKKL